MAAPGFVGRVAQRFDGAIDAARFSGDADLATVVDEFVGELDPMVAGDDLHQVLLDLLWVFGLGEAEAAGDAEDVRIDDDAFSEAECNSEDDVAGFAGYSWKREQFGHGFGDFAAELCDE